MMGYNKILTIIIPVFNEELVIEKFLDQLKSIVEKLSRKHDCRVLFVNNGSTDNSLEILNSRSFQFTSFGVLTLTRNFGYEAALVAGLNYVKSGFYALCDADGEDPLELLLDFQEQIMLGNEIVIGIRKKRFESSITRIFRNLSYRFLSKISDDPFIRNAGNFSIFSEKVRNAILTENNSFPFLRATLSRTGYSTVEFVHDRNPRIDGKSKYRKFGLLKFAVAGFMTATTWPLRFIAYAAVFNIFTFFTYFFSSLFFSATIDKNSFYYCLILFLATEIIIFLGVIALYLARIYKNSLGRPLFYVDWNRSWTKGLLTFDGR
jgi:glycosyltransferase involved in cell wall biosynthesis